MVRHYLFLFFTMLWIVMCNAQTATIKGKVINTKTGEKLSYASIQSNKTNITTADSHEHYIFSV